MLKSKILLLGVIASAALFQITAEPITSDDLAHYTELKERLGAFAEYAPYEFDEDAFSQLNREINIFSHANYGKRPEIFFILWLQLDIIDQSNDFLSLIASNYPRPFIGNLTPQNARTLYRMTVPHGTEITDEDVERFLKYNEEKRLTRIHENELLGAISTHEFWLCGMLSEFFSSSELENLVYPMLLLRCDTDEQAASVTEYIDKAFREKKEYERNYEILRTPPADNQ